jgi:hypothetical protein
MWKPLAVLLDGLRRLFGGNSAGRTAPDAKAEPGYARMKQVQSRRMALIDRALEQLNGKSSPPATDAGRAEPERASEVAYRFDSALAMSVGLLLQRESIDEAWKAVRADGRAITPSSEDVSPTVLGELLPLLEQFGCTIPAGDQLANGWFLAVLSPEDADRFREQLAKLATLLTPDDLRDGIGLVLYLDRPEILRAGMEFLRQECLAVPGSGVGLLYC